MFPILKGAGVRRGSGEWFYTTVKNVRAAVVATRNRTRFVQARTEDFSMRAEQKAAVEKTAEYLHSANYNHHIY